MSVEKKDAEVAEPQTMEEMYPKEFEENASTGDVYIAEGAEPVEDEPEDDEPEEPEGEPEGDEPDEPEGEPAKDTGEELKPLDDEEEGVVDGQEESGEEPGDDEGTVPIHVLQKERKRRQAAEARNREPVQAPQAAIQPQPVPMPTPDVKVPVESDYEDRDDFLVAKAAHVAKQDLIKEQAQQNALFAQQQAQARQNEILSSYENNVAADVLKKPEAFKDHEEDETFINSIGLDGFAIHSIMTAERPAPIVKYLAKHPAEAMKIAKMSPLQQVEEIGHLKKRSMVAVKPRNVTKASAPITPERGDSSPPRPTKFAKDMSENDYNKRKASLGDSATVGDLIG